MPFLTPNEALRMKLVDCLPENSHAYLYDLMTESFIYIGRPISPCEIEHIHQQ